MCNDLGILLNQCGFAVIIAESTYYIAVSDFNATLFMFQVRLEVQVEKHSWRGLTEVTRFFLRQENSYSML